MKFLVANSLLVFFLGVGIIYQVKSKKVEPAPVITAKSVKPEPLRNPASVEKTINVFPKTITKLKKITSDNELVKNFECLEKDKMIKTSNESIILSGHHCADLKKIRITNLSNGYTAAVFELNEKKYKTDLIPLAEGDNKISVEYEINSKKKEITETKAFFTIKREK